MKEKEEKQPYLSAVRRAKMIEQCREWTQKDGYFPLDAGLDFGEMSNKRLKEYHECYFWALDENNFKTFNLSNKKGG